MAMYDDDDCEILYWCKPCNETRYVLNKMLFLAPEN